MWRLWRPQVMMRLKNTRNLDARQSMLLDNAYFAVRPPERMGARRKKRPPEQEYVRHLVRECLAKDQVKTVRWCLSPICSSSHPSARKSDGYVATSASCRCSWHPLTCPASPDMPEFMRGCTDVMKRGAVLDVAGHMLASASSSASPAPWRCGTMQVLDRAAAGR